MCPQTSDQSHNRVLCEVVWPDVEKERRMQQNDTLFVVQLCQRQQILMVSVQYESRTVAQQINITSLEYHCVEYSYQKGLFGMQ